MRTKTQIIWAYEQWLVKCYEVYEGYINFNTEQVENTKRADRQKTSFPKAYVENADLHKFVFNKIMTIHE